METRATLDHATSEKAFMQAVIDSARLHGWLVYHTHDARRSEPGFPDLVLLRGPQILVFELKTERGKLSDAQKRWLSAFEAAAVPTYVLRPSAWDEIQLALR